MSEAQNGGTARLEVQDTLTVDERAELERLRQENATLRETTSRPRRRIRWRSVIAVVLIVVGCVLAPVSLVAVWTHTEVSDTDTFVATAGPLIDDPAVQEALTNRVTTTVFQYVDVQGLADQAIAALAAQGLPPQLVARLKTFTPALASAVTGFVRDKVGQVIAGPQFASAWNQALRLAHQQLVTVLSGDSQAIAVQGGTVYLDLAPFIDAAKQRLAADGLTAVNVIPEVHPMIALAPADKLVRAQSASRRPGLGRHGIAVDHVAGAGRGRLSGASAVAGAGRGRPRRCVGPGPARGRATRGTSAAGRGGPGGRRPGRGRKFRHHCGIPSRLRAGVAGARAGRGTGSLPRGIVRERHSGAALGHGPAGPHPRRTVGGRTMGSWVAAHVRGLRIGAVALAALVFVFLPQPTGAAILLIAAGLLVVLAVIEFLARPGSPPIMPSTQPDPA